MQILHGRRPAIALRLAMTTGLSAMAVFGLCGCGGAADGIPIGGKVTYKGEPVTSGEVVYTPVVEDKKAGEDESTASQARGFIQQDGTFEMATSPSVSGVLPGKYAISIVTLEGGDAAPAGPSGEAVGRPEGEGREAKSAIPEKYLRPATSGLEDVVDESHSGTNNIVLED